MQLATAGDESLVQGTTRVSRPAQPEKGLTVVLIDFLEADPEGRCMIKHWQLTSGLSSLIDRCLV